MIDNNIVYLARLHWIIFFLPGCLFCLSVFLDYVFPMLHEVSILSLFFSLAWAGMAWVTYQYSSLTIKKNQVILRTGFWVRQTMDIPMSKIESIDIRRSLLGSLLQYGTLVITGTGGSRQTIDFLNQPLTCRRYIEQLMH